MASGIAHHPTGHAGDLYRGPHSNSVYFGNTILATVSLITVVVHENSRTVLQNTFEDQDEKGFGFFGYCSSFFLLLVVGSRLLATSYYSSTSYY